MNQTPRIIAHRGASVAAPENTLAAFRLAVEANTIDARFHAVADEGVALRDIATLIGRRLGVPVMDITTLD